ncbi:O-methyltransferase [Dactylosporangium sp. CS-047395]|uniref:O-methyltransferase n=1 Tax=Dactylosporangium sp. CS-047395 TaxID=3239936 RepID=UPI003D8B2367
MSGPVGRLARRTVGPLAGHRMDVLAMQSLAPLSADYVPWSPMAMRPSGIAGVLAEVYIHDVRHVVELGGGVSTFYLARLLHRRGGHLCTVEHDPRWADLLREALDREGLAGTATVVHAPLARDGWYDRGALEHLRHGPIGLLLVDGPPAYEHPGARYPALPHFAAALAPDAIVILDDIGRRGEERTLRRWERETPYRFERRLVRGGIAVGRSPAAT